MHIVRQPIRADHGGRILEHALHVVLAHLEVAGASRLQPLARLLLRAAPFGGDGGEHAPSHLRMRRRPRHHDVDNAVDHLLAQNGRARDVRIHIERDWLLRPCGVDVGERLDAAAPVSRPRAFVMRNDHRQVAPTTGGERLVERVDHLVGLVADMRGVYAPRVAGDAREQRKLFDVGRRAGRIEHAGAQARRACVHAFAQQLDHPRLLGRRGRTVRIVHRRHPQGRVTDQRRDVDGGPRRAERSDIGGHRRIDVLVAAQQVERRRHVGMHERRQTDAAITDDDGGDALADLGQHLRRGQ